MVMGSDPHSPIRVWGTATAAADGGVRPGDPSTPQERSTDTRWRWFRRATSAPRRTARTAHHLAFALVQPARAGLRAGDRGHSRRLRRRRAPAYLGLTYRPELGSCRSVRRHKDRHRAQRRALRADRRECGAANACGPADYSSEMRLSFRSASADHGNATAPGGGTEPPRLEDFTMALHSLGVCAERIDLHRLDLRLDTF